MAYAIYLRKSRKDLDAEQRGEGETLGRHRRELLALAGRLCLPIAREYWEIVTGESIAARPEMQALLADVSAGLYDGVLVYEIERLARGDTMDQGIIAQAFKYADTKIITPGRTFDPNDPADEEYFEFNLFMSRREYATIRRRLLAGREQAVREGKWPNANCPDGYEVVSVECGKGYTLRIVPERAAVIRMIFDWYINQHTGAYAIASRLNSMGLHTQAGGAWCPSTVRTILRNVVYTGKVKWYSKSLTKKVMDGRVVKAMARTPEKQLILPGLHEAIIPEATFAAAQAIMSNALHAPIPRQKAVVNPLAGLVFCGSCGHAMLRQVNSKQTAYLTCKHPTCRTIGARLDLIEARLLDALKGWTQHCHVSHAGSGIEAPDTATEDAELALVDKELAALEKQRLSVHGLLERGIYTDAEFLERRARINVARAQLSARRLEVEAARSKKACARAMVHDIAPRILGLAEAYCELRDTEEKNIMLKEVLKRAVYSRTSGGNGTDPDSFVLDIFPRVPKL